MVRERVGAVGAQDFVGLDYCWGLPTWKVGKFRSLEDAAQGKFLKAPVWPKGLYHALRRFHRWFPGQELFIAENGSVPVANGVSRTDYLRSHIAEVERAIDHGVPVMATISGRSPRTASGVTRSIRIRTSDSISWTSTRTRS